MRLQRFADAHNWTITGEIRISRDHFARFYADGARVAIVRPLGVFTGLVCANGSTYYVMTSDWEVAQRIPTAQAPASP